MDEKWASSELTGLNSTYLESLYESYLKDPTSVDPEMKAYFDKIADGHGDEEVCQGPIKEAFKNITPQVGFSTGMATSSSDTGKLIAVMDLIYAYRYVGHLKADIDPLGLLKRPNVDDLTLEYHGLSQADLNESFDIKDLNYTNAVKLKDIVSELKRIYCGHVGIEYMYMTNHVEKMWLRKQVERTSQADFSKEQKVKILDELLAADGMEKYLGMKYVGKKRFSLEGGDSLIPLLHELIEQAAQNGIEQIATGMAHRGRLNVLVNILGKSPAALLAEFDGHHDETLLAGDVKYHNGFSSDVCTASGAVHVSLAFNPSHLEIVAPVVEGSVRARQSKREFNRNSVMAIHMHGDSAFAGQGVVLETLNMSQTNAYHTGGSIHIVINNQIGFTTNRSSDVRSSTYCTDIAKMIEAPVFHVNGDDPEALVRVAKIAVDYRMKFNKDVIIDLVCYRTHGHNEADEPAATQPLMYQTIKKHPVPWVLYAEKLESEGVIKPGEAKAKLKAYQARLEIDEPVVNIDCEHKARHGEEWSPYLGVPWTIAHSTKIKKSDLIAIAKRLDEVPANFNMQRQVQKLMLDRAKMTRGEIPVNWGYAEMLAYATLLDSGTFIRFTGEDVQRGTFSHRHAVLHDQQTGEEYTPLKNATTEKDRLVMHNSLLSELAVLGYEYGFSCATPNALTIWEAQFGDFVNMAQPIIDQFISSAEEKWGRLCGLIMLLPHGYEGMGAEHSSARLERFLQLCANDNMQVCIPTTPAQIFHMIRRQMLRPYRKPLIALTPKSLLRHPLCTSTLDDLADGEFQVVIPEVDKIPTQKVKRVILCQGKVYYDLLAKRREQKIDDIAIIRLEQLYPFPYKALEFALKPYTHVTDIMWCQEEPKNQGAWYITQHEIKKALSDKQILQSSTRDASAAPAVGYPSLHIEQQEALVNQALDLRNKK